jgi:hypothetical protein
MPIIRHEGRDYYLKTLRFKCLDCWTLCETSVVGNPRSQASCRCGQVNIDGGISLGSTINGNPHRMEDLSVYRTIDVPYLRLPQEAVTARHALLLSIPTAQ